METRKTIRKWYWIWEFEKEEEWLNEMAQAGWVLDGVGFATYHFRRCEPGEYTVRLEMHPADDEYIQFMKDTGAEYIDRMVMWVYFRKKMEDGPFDLFSDLDSKIGHLKKIGNMLWPLCAMNIVIGIINDTNGLHIGWINLLVASLLTYSLGRIHGKIESLERDRQLHE